MNKSAFSTKIATKEEERVFVSSCLSRQFLASNKENNWKNKNNHPK